MNKLSIKFQAYNYISETSLAQTGQNIIDFEWIEIFDSSDKWIDLAHLI